MNGMRRFESSECDFVFFPEMPDAELLLVGFLAIAI